MGKKIQHKRGLKQDMPMLATSEFGFTTDTEETYIGTNNKNIRLLDEKDRNELDSTIKNKAEKSVLESSVFIDVATSQHRDEITNSNYYLVNIPHKDSKGNLIKLKRGFGKDNPASPSLETAREFSTRNNATVAINASPFNVEKKSYFGIQIVDGDILSGIQHEWRWTFGIKNDNQLVAYSPSTTPQQILADGCKNALVGFIPLFVNGKSVSQSVINSYADANLKYARQIIIQKKNKDIAVFTCDDRVGSNGMDVQDIISLLNGMGDIDFAFHLDGGGSTQTVVRHRLLNQSKDNNNYTERPVIDFLYIGNNVVDLDQRNADTYRVTTDLSDVAKKVADTDVNLNDLSKKISETSTLLSALGNFNKAVKVVNNANDILDNGFYWLIPSAIANPTGDASYWLAHIRYDDDHSLQVAFSFQTPSRLRVRRKNKNTWESWNPVV